MSLFASAVNASEPVIEAGKEFTINLDPSQLATYGPLGAVAVLLLVSVQQLRKQEGGVKFFGTMLTVAIMSLVGWGGARMHKSSDFDARVSDYVVAAYNATTPEEAKLQYDRALSVMKENKMTEGSTSILYPSPEYNVGDWFAKVEKTEKDLTEMLKAPAVVDDKKADPKVLTPWQKSLVENNVVKTKVDTKGNSHASFNAPEDISVHPYTLQYALWFYSSLIATLLFGAGFVAKTHKNW